MSDIRTKGIDEKFCESCGQIIKIAAEICPKCGVRQKSAKATAYGDASNKSRLVAFLFCTFLGWIGVHRFYVGKITSGIMQILFGWLTFGIWWLVDWIMILAGGFKDINGKTVSIWDPDN